MQLVAYYEDGVPTTAFFLGMRKTIRNCLVPRRGLFLNRTGIPILDSLWNEYNCFLNNKTELNTFVQILDSLPFNWDEITMMNLDCDLFPGICLWCNAGPYNLIQDDETLARCVDLELVRQQDGNYFNLLSRKTRSHLRKSVRLYEAHGPIECRRATELPEALGIIDELVQAHMNMWGARGQQGSFGYEYFLNFHKTLIQNRFETGEIQLLKIMAGTKPLGYLYNFLYDQKVYAYQTGFNYEPDNRLKPGLISHSKAIELNARTGQAIYDFLGGNDRYKKNLGTGDRKMVSVRVQKPRFRFRIEKRIETAARSVMQKYHRRQSTT
jgi:hypothetical protein